jgi:hypothetical protein
MLTGLVIFAGILGVLNFLSSAYSVIVLGAIIKTLTTVITLLITGLLGSIGYAAFLKFRKKV